MEFPSDNIIVNDVSRGGSILKSIYAASCTARSYIVAVQVQSSRVDLQQNERQPHHADFCRDFRLDDPATLQPWKEAASKASLQDEKVREI